MLSSGPASDDKVFEAITEAAYDKHPFSPKGYKRIVFGWMGYSHSGIAIHFRGSGRFIPRTTLSD